MHTTDDNDYLVQTVELGVTRAGRAIIHGVSLGVGRGEIVTIVGPNGAGKSTLLKAVLGLITPTTGQVERAPGVIIGYVPQRMQCDPVLPLTVREFVALAPKARLTSQAALTMTGAVAQADKQLANLSGGELQRALLARAMITQPDLLILDEPAQGIDVTGARELHQFLEHLRGQHGVSVLLVSHDIHFVMATTDRVICLNQHICCSGSPTAVCSDPWFSAVFGGGFGVYHHQHDHIHPTPGFNCRNAAGCK